MVGSIRLAWSVPFKADTAVIDFIIINWMANE